MKIALNIAFALLLVGLGESPKLASGQKFDVQNPKSPLLESRESLNSDLPSKGYPDIVGKTEDDKPDVTFADRITQQLSRFSPNPKQNSHAFLEIATEASKALSLIEFVPESRVNFFDWCNNDNMKIIGWTGSVEILDQTEEGFLIRLRVRPQLASGTVFEPSTTDYLQEYYLCDLNNEFHYLDSEPNPGIVGHSVIGF